MLSKEDRARLRETLRPHIEGDPYIVGIVHQHRPSLDGATANQLLDELDEAEARAEKAEFAYQCLDSAIGECLCEEEQERVYAAATEWGGK